MERIYRFIKNYIERPRELKMENRVEERGNVSMTKRNPSVKKNIDSGESGKERNAFFPTRKGIL